MSEFSEERQGHYTAAELARYVGVHVRTLRRWVAKGKIPKPACRADNGYGLWTPEQAREVLRWRLSL